MCTHALPESGCVRVMCFGVAVTSHQLSLVVEDLSAEMKRCARVDRKNMLLELISTGRIFLFM